MESGPSTGMSTRRTRREPSRSMTDDGPPPLPERWPTRDDPLSEDSHASSGRDETPESVLLEPESQESPPRATRGRGPGRPPGKGRGRGNGRGKWASGPAGQANRRQDAVQTGTVQNNATDATGLEDMSIAELDRMIRTLEAKRERQEKMERVKTLTQELALRTQATSSQPASDTLTSTVLATRPRSDTLTEDHPPPKRQAVVARVKQPEPQRFQAKSNDERITFIRDCERAFRLDPEQFKTELNKCDYAASYLAPGPVRTEFNQRWPDEDSLKTLTWIEFTAWLAQMGQPRDRTLQEIQSIWYRASQRPNQSARDFADYLASLEMSIPEKAEQERAFRLFDGLLNKTKETMESSAARENGPIIRP